jgi:hypothetical protein
MKISCHLACPPNARNSYPIITEVGCYLPRHNHHSSRILSRFYAYSTPPFPPTRPSSRQRSCIVYDNKVVEASQGGLARPAERFPFWATRNSRFVANWRMQNKPGGTVKHQRMKSTIHHALCGSWHCKSLNLIARSLVPSE